MKNLLRLAPVFVFIVSLCSCADTHSMLWGDNIQLSAKTAVLSANSDSVTFTTGGESWWLTSVSVDNVYFRLPQDVNPDAASYTFKQDCFVVERRNKQVLFIKVEKNLTKSARSIVVMLQAGDYFDSVVVTQKPMP